ncbi:MAG: chitobiase/beta-hexosaminidase C-terminal domain-containing protein [Terracidiphilus sp.]
MRFGGATGGELLGKDQSPTVTNYYIGADKSQWHLRVPSFRAVTIPNIYDGIDVVYHGNGKELEYDFIVSPAADPKQIRMDFAGLSARLKGNNICFDEESGICLRSLKAYQKVEDGTRNVDVAWELHGNQASIKLGSYDRQRELVIDPIFSYGTFIGGGGTDAAVSILPSATANVFYIAESTTSPALTEPLGQPSSSPNSSGTETLILELNAAGGPSDPYSVAPTITSATYIGAASGSAVPAAMAADSSFNLYVTGSTSGGGSVPQMGTQLCAANCPSFVAKLDSALNLTFASGLSVSSPNAIAADAQGNAYLTGAATAGSLTIPTADTTFQAGVTAGSALTSGSHAFLLELNSSGTEVFASYIGGSGSEQGTAIAVSGQSVYVAGQTSSADFPTTSGAAQTGYGGTGSGNAVSPVPEKPATLNGDGFVVAATALSTDPALTFSTYLGGAGDDYPSSIAIDSYDQNVVIAGTTTSVFPTSAVTPLQYYQVVVSTVLGSEGTTVTLETTSSSDTLGSQLGFVYSLSFAGNVNFLNLLGGIQGDTTTANAVAVDPAGVIYLAGSNNSVLSSGSPTTGFLGGSALRFDFYFPGTGGTHMYLGEIDPTGNYLLEGALSGGSGVDQPEALALSTGVASLVGTTTSTTDLFASTNEAYATPPDLPPSVSGTQAGFFINEQTAGFCNMGLTGQVGSVLTFSGPCSPGTTGGSLSGTVTAGATMTNVGPVPITIVDSTGTASLDLSAFSGQITLAVSFTQFGPTGAAGDACLDAREVPRGCPVDKSQGGITTVNGNGSGTVFSTTSGQLSVALTCPGASCTYGGLTNTVLAGQAVQIDANVSNGKPDTVSWPAVSGASGVLSQPTAATIATFTAGRAGGTTSLTVTATADGTTQQTIVLTTVETPTLSVATANAGTITYGQTVSVQVAASGVSGTPSGPITYQVDGGVAAASTLSSGGVASIQLTGLSGGTHALTVSYPGNLGSSQGYFTPTSATLNITVSPATLTIQAQNASVKYGNPIPSFTYQMTGFEYSDSASSITGIPAETSTATVASLPGQYPITITQGTLQSSTNYTYSFVNGVLTITSLGSAVSPAVNLPAGVYTAPQSVTFSDATAGSKVYYTLDGTVPTTSSLLFGGPITVSQTTTIQAIAAAPGFDPSVVVTETLTISPPAFSPASLNFGAVVYGQPAGAQNIIFKNIGLNTLTGFSILPFQGANAGDFSIVSGSTTCGTTLASGASCTIVIAFIPAAAGARSAQLLLSYTGAGSPESIGLTGVGLAPLMISSSPPQLIAGTTFQFTANQSVTWTASAGTIDPATGLFTAPSTVPTPPTVSITAASTASSTSTITLEVTIVAQPSVSFTASSNAMTQGGSLSIPFSIGAGTGIPGEQYLIGCTPATLPSGVTCTSTPNPLMDGGTMNGTLVISSSQLNVGRAAPARPLGRIPIGGTLALACLVLIPFRMRRSRKALLALMLLSFAALFGLSGCGTNGNFKVTSQPTYVTGTFTINVSVTGATPNAPDFNQTVAISPIQITISQ